MKESNLRYAIRSSWFKKFTLSMLCTALIPMLVIMVLYFQRVDQSIKTEMIESYQRDVNSFQEQQDSIWKSISSLTASLNSNTVVLDYIQNTYDPLSANAVRIALSRMIASNPSIDDIFIFSPMLSEPIISSRYVFDTNSLNTAPLISGQSAMTAFAKLKDNDVATATYLDLNYGQFPEPYDVVLYRVSGFFHSVNPYSYRLVFSVRIDSLLQFSSLTQTDGAAVRGAVLMARGGETLGLSGQDPEKLQTVLHALPLTRQRGHRSLDTGLGQYEALWADDHASQFRAVLLLPGAEIAGPIEKELIRLTVLFFVVAVCMVTLFLVLLLRNYSPVHNLEEACSGIMEEISASRQVAAGKNPFENIDAALQIMQSQISALKQVITNHQAVVRNDALLSLLRLRGDAEATEKNLEECGIRFQHNAFSLLYITIDNAELSFAHFQDEAERFFHNRLFDCYAANGTNGCYVLLINHPPCNENSLMACVNDFKNRLMDDEQTEMIIGMAWDVCGIRDLPALYGKAKLAHEYHFLMGSTLVVYSDIDQLMRPAASLSLYTLERSELLQYIRSANLEQAQNQLRRMQTNLSQYGGGIWEMRHICYDLVFSIIQVLNECCGERRYHVDFDDLMQVHTVDRMFERMQAICATALSKKETVERRYPSIESINASIAEQYSDLFFSISRLAEDYHMSSSAFSQYYRKKTGMTISEYLMRYRIEQAMQLLLTTDKQIGQIVTEIGYYSSSSFIKKFKAYTGQTPGEYRATHRERPAEGTT